MDAARRPALGALSGGATPSRLRPLPLTAWLLAVALGAEVAYIPIASPRFAVRAVEVRGDERVAQAVAPRLQLGKAGSILFAPLKAIERQAEADPAVREARASRAFPGRIVVMLERREPLAVIRRPDAAVLIDPDGVPFTVADEWGWGLPELSAPSLGRGDLRSSGARGEIRDLLAVLRALGPDPRLRVTRIQLGRDGRLELALDSGAIVYLGEAADLGAKARLLVAAMEEIGIERIRRLDLSVPGSAWWEPRQGGRSVQMRQS
ncbi:MAG: cell division protein FtsQ/DivIB [Armatimonadota bacterium]